MSEKPSPQILKGPLNNWPGKNNQGRDAVVAILIPLILCMLVKWGMSRDEATIVNHQIMLAYLIGLVVCFSIKLKLQSKLNTLLGVLKDLPDLCAYAQAANGVASQEANRQFLLYAQVRWCFDMLLAGFAVAGIFDSFFR